MLSIAEFRTEYRNNPIGIDTESPRFFWILKSDKKATIQEHYQLHVKEDGKIVWDSGIVNSKQSIHVEYDGEGLKACTRYEVILEVKDNHGDIGRTNGWFETGLMNPVNMKADWITHGYEDDVECCPVFTKEFPLIGKVLNARIYTSALGVYELKVNGMKADDSFLAPGWTSYHHRLQYQIYNVTELLNNDNIIEMTVGNGWFKGQLGWENESNHYGKRTAIISQLQIDYKDGTSETIVTDTSWEYTTGIRRSSELYAGEVIDLTFKGDTKKSVRTFEYDKTVLVAQECAPVRITERVNAKKIIITPKEEVVIDFGQNLTGVIEAKVNFLKGTSIVIQHAEVLDENGNFYTENLRGAQATDTFICSGGDDLFLPALTFHGFRYIKIEGIGKDIDLNAFTACVLHTDMEVTGTFSCSHKSINQLQSNILWSQRDNFLDIPTDCPQRDERLGWTGDAQVFAATAGYNMDVAQFFAKWLRDLAQEQTVINGVLHVVPNILENTEGAAAWGDAATVIPWCMYEIYADKRILKEQYQSMKDWVAYIQSKAGDNQLWQSGFQFGDWLGLDMEEGSDRIGATDVYLVASAYYALSTSLVIKAAKVLGYNDDIEHYQKLYDRIRESFRKEYITQTGRLVSETQTACLLALHFDLAQGEHRDRIIQSLIDNLKRHDNHLVTGFVGTPYLCLTLSENDQHNLAGEVFLKSDYPSWLYEVGMGATTIWERWNSMKEDGSIDNDGMNSFNHYAYGSIGEWMYKKLGGIELLEPGYEKIQIAPKPIDGITWVDTSVKTMYGPLSCHWTKDNEHYTVKVTIPVNTTAVLVLPGTNERVELGSGDYSYDYISKD